ncbi:MAG: polysaccharide deacetylase family protein [Oscillospiraceae bacterium]|nr:polysaccharide deacetylase family protein [Oscillospiraceae bacterium]
MYRCISSGKMGLILAAAAIFAALWLVMSVVGKVVAVQDTVPKGVFLPVIMYHSLTEPTNDYQLSPDVFADDLAYLKRHGYQSVSVSQLLAYTNGSGELPEHPILITFDDGFYNNLSAALPLLKEYGMCAVVSVVGRYTDEIAPADPHTPRYSYLTWEDIRTMLASGCIELGSHTYDLHSNDTRAGCSIVLGEDPATYTEMLKNDLQTMQDHAKTETGISPTIFAYPYGFICRESIPVLQKMGFVCTLTCREVPNYITRDPKCLYALGRYHRSPKYSTEEFFEKVLRY